MINAYSPNSISVEKPSDPDKPTTWLWILLGCLATVVVIGVIAIVFYRQKVKKKISYYY